MHTILLAEDSEDDAFFVTRAFSEINAPCTLQVSADGKRAIDYLKGTNQYGDRRLFPLPDFVLLDINLPQVNGLEVLDWIRRDSPLEDLPVAMFTNYNEATYMN